MLSTHGLFLLSAVLIAIGFAGLWVLAKRACDRLIHELFFAASEPDEHAALYEWREG